MFPISHKSVRVSFFFFKNVSSAKKNNLKYSNKTTNKKTCKNLERNKTITTKINSRLYYVFKISTASDGSATRGETIFRHFERVL